MPTAAPINPHWDVCEAVRAALEGAAIEGLNPPQVREIPYVLGGADSFPLLLVCPQEQGKRLLRRTFKGPVWAYPVLVLLIFKTNLELRTNLEQRLLAAHRVTALLDAGRIDGAAAHEYDPDPRAAADVAAALGTNYVVTGVQLLASVAEAKGG